MALDPNPLTTPFLTRKSASAFLALKLGIKVTVSALASYATNPKKQGMGPPFYRWGAKGAQTYYKPEELDAWVQSKLKKPEPW